MTHIPVITIDGPSGSGKGAITHRLAEALGFHILDSGALYRLIGLAARRRNIALDAEDALVKLALELEIEFQPTSDPEEPIEILLFGERVTRDLRTNEAGTDASKVAPIEAVREAIKDLQQDFRKAPGLIADGRDMGTVVFVDADAKIYLTASAETRAERRYKQLKDKGIDVSLHALFISIQERDERDMNREVAPLIPAADARVIDSTKMDIDQVFNEALAFVRERLAN
ncbi:MAG: (d)CMP kinase [Pseudomonadales bacterium]|jgi:cytidylate kinase|tara:strand:+ start:18752 stop:19438 length:687 start_codon:yes stop_codon:yes gene_type:complete